MTTKKDAEQDLQTQSGFGLCYESARGTFRIRPESGDSGTVALEVNREGDRFELLGKYAGINDAILAVVRQETGFREWDGLEPAEVPLRVHDISSWKISD